MLRVAVVEDETSVMAQIEGFLARYESERGVPMEVTAFRDGSELLADYRPVFDIILLDIEMPQVDGMAAAEQIRRTDQNVVIVFITNMAQYAIQGYSVGALRFFTPCPAAPSGWIPGRSTMWRYRTGGSTITRIRGNMCSGEV